MPGDVVVILINFAAYMFFAWYLILSLFMQRGRVSQLEGRGADRPFVSQSESEPFFWCCAQSYSVSIMAVLLRM